MIALMIWLLVIMGILLIFAIVFLCPVMVDLRFQDDFLVKIKVLGIPFQVYPKKEKDKPVDQRKKNKKQKEKKGKLSKIKGILEREGVSGLLDFIKEISNIVTGTGKSLLSYVIIYRLSLSIVISDENAAQTALQYGQACAVVYPVANAVTTGIKCKKSHICVIPDFEDKKSKADFRLKAGIRPIFIITAGMKSLFKFINVYRKYIARSSNH